MTQKKKLIQQNNMKKSHPLYLVFVYELSLLISPILIGYVLYLIYGHDVYNDEKSIRLIYKNSLAAIYLRYVTFGPILFTLPFFIKKIVPKAYGYISIILFVAYLLHFVLIYPFFIYNFKEFWMPIIGFPFHWIISLTAISFLILFRTNFRINSNTNN